MKQVIVTGQSLPNEYHAQPIHAWCPLADAEDQNIEGSES